MLLCVERTYRSIKTIDVERGTGIREISLAGDKPNLYDVCRHQTSMQIALCPV